jgi:hypothetical protein
MESQVLSPKPIEVNPCNLDMLRASKLGLITSHGVQVLSPKYDMDVYMAILFEGDLGFGLRVGLSKKLDSTLNISPKNSLHEIIEIHS